jgi:hypothetical protein
MTQVPFSNNLFSGVARCGDPALDNVSMIVYTFTTFDTRMVPVKLLRLKSALPEVEFCDRCGSVCDTRCRTDALRAQAIDRVLRFGGRI